MSRMRGGGIGNAVTPQTSGVFVAVSGDTMTGNLTMSGNTIIFAGGSGAATAPNISFTQDSRTGFWNSQSGRINVSLSGTNTFLFLSNGFRFLASSGNTNILDTAGNEFLKFVIPGVGSASNEFTIQSAATGSNPRLFPTGGDSNIGIEITTKGSGTINFLQPIVASGGMSILRTAVSDAAYTATGSDFLIALTALTANRTITLPTATTSTGRKYIINDETGNAGFLTKITLDGSGTETINGVSGLDITSPYGVLRVYSNGNSWYTW